MIDIVDEAAKEKESALLEIGRNAMPSLGASEEDSRTPVAFSLIVDQRDPDLLANQGSQYSTFSLAYKGSAGKADDYVVRRQILRIEARGYLVGLTIWPFMRQWVLGLKMTCIQ